MHLITRFNLMDILIDPDEFFRNEAENPDILRPGLILVASSLVGVITPVIIMNKIMTVVTDTNTFITVGIVISVLTSFLSIYMVWIVYSLIFFIITIPLGGEGEFRDLFKLIGWGFIPYIFSGIVGATISYLAIQNTPFIAGEMTIVAYMGNVNNSQIMNISKASSTIFFAWSGFMWVFAVKHARNLNIRRSVITVGIPVLISIIYRIVTI